MLVLFASTRLAGVFHHWELKVGDKTYFVGRPPCWSEASTWDGATVVKMGTTKKTHKQIEDYMEEEKMEEYDLVSNNCQHVAERLAQFLQITPSSDCGQLPKLDDVSRVFAVGSSAATAGAAGVAHYAAGLALGSVGGPAVAGAMVATSMFYFVPLPACNADLRFGGDTSNTCDLADASFLIVTEEGSGHCYYYPYDTKDEAMADFGSWYCSRLLFEAVEGEICQTLTPGDDVKEIKQGGFAHPYNTIRRAAARFVKR